MTTVTENPGGDLVENRGKTPWVLIGGGVAAAALIGGGAYAATMLGGGGDLDRDGVGGAEEGEDDVGVDRSGGSGRLRGGVTGKHRGDD